LGELWWHRHQPGTENPNAPLAQGKDGNLDGTTALGGKNGFGGTSAGNRAGLCFGEP